jgi:hypothetical protein
MKYFTRYLLLILLLIQFSAFRAALPAHRENHNLHAETIPNNYNIVIHFRAVADAQELEFGKTYKNFFEEAYTVRKFKFYISNIRLTNTSSGKMTVLNSDEYFLIDFSDTASTTIQFSAASCTFNQVSFMLGVDSMHNTSGAQTGALDPVKGMFWTWNSGYVAAKLEGNAPVSNQPDRLMEYHIGGYKYPNKVAKDIDIVTARELKALPGKTIELTITANAGAWFHGAHDIRISETPSCATPGTLAKNIAENYANMFTLTHISN